MKIMQSEKSRKLHGILHAKDLVDAVDGVKTAPNNIRDARWNEMQDFKLHEFWVHFQLTYYIAIEHFEIMLRCVWRQMHTPNVVTPLHMRNWRQELFDDDEMNSLAIKEKREEEREENKVHEYTELLKRLRVETFISNIHLHVVLYLNLKRFREWAK